MVDGHLFVPFAGVTKNDDGTCTVYGKVTDESLDADAQITDLDWFRSQLPEWSKWSNIREMHKTSAVGIGLSTEDTGDAIWLEAKIVDKEAALKCEEGVYKGFSYGLKSVPGNPYKVVKDAGAPNGRICGGALIEISVVDRPANGNSSFSVVKNTELLDKEADNLRKLSDAAALIRSVVSPASAPVQDELSELEEMFVGKRDWSTDERRDAAESGHAMPDGSFPIDNEEDLHNAVRLAGHAKDPAAARRHIRQRARALGMTSELPDSWKGIFPEIEKAPISVQANVSMSTGVYGEMTYEEAVKEILDSLGLGKEADEADLDENLVKAVKAVETQKPEPEEEIVDKAQLAEVIKGLTLEEREELGLGSGVAGPSQEEFDALKTELVELGKRVIPTGINMAPARPTMPSSGELEALKAERAIYEELVTANDSMTAQYAQLKLNNINKAIAAASE